MTKKDFQTFARMIRTQQHQIITVVSKDYTDGQTKQIDSFVDELVIIFQNDNPDFKADKFIAACNIDQS